MKKGFTLIELLIVIGILAALAMAVLPALSVSRTEALEGICSANQGTSLKTLKEYYTLFGCLPNGFHSGLTAAEDGQPMPFPSAFSSNLSGTGVITTLDAAEAKALNDIGVQQLAYGNGKKDATGKDEVLGYENVAADSSVMAVTSDWKDDGGNPYTFNGKSVALLADEGYSKVIAVFITPTVDWSSGSASGNSWAKAVKEYGIDIAGRCPVPDAEFAYYVAYIGIRPVDTYVAKFDGVHANVPAKTDIADMRTAVSGLTASGGALDGYATTATGDWETATFTKSGSPDVTVTIDTVKPGAILLGTSCPECGITNP